MGTNTKREGTLSGTDPSLTIQMVGEFNISVWGLMTGSVSIQRSFDQGANWITCSRNADGDPATYTASFSIVVDEPETDVIYRLLPDLSAGTPNYRISSR